MTGELLKMEVPRDIAVYEGRMLAVVIFSPGGGRACVCMCAHGTGGAAEQGNSYLLCVLAGGRMILPTVVTPQGLAGHR